jgi:hypothetical protein
MVNIESTIIFFNEEIHYCNIGNAHIIFEPARKQRYERQI